MERLLELANWSTVAACAVLKVPQLGVVLAAKSARGLSLESLVLELSGFLVCLRYHSYYSYPLPTYVEYPIIIVQDVILFLFVLHYNGRMKHALPYIVTAKSMIAELQSEHSPAVYSGMDATFLHKAFFQVKFQNLSTLVSAASKFAQLRCLWQTKDSGQVSTLTWSLATYTCAARIFTTLMSTKDLTVLVRFVVMMALNIWVTVTILHYRKTAKKMD